MLSPASAAGAEEADRQQITKTLNTLFPELTITRITVSMIPGLYEVMLGPEVIYASKDGRFVLKGDMLDLQERRNLSEDKRANARKEIFNHLSPDEVIEFAPERADHTIYVFTDIDCGYCRRLHQDVPVLNKNGVTVRYLAFPRTGEGSKSYRQMESVWCADDRKQALTDAKFGKQVQSRQCKNPVAKQYELGQSMGVHGTPAIYLENGYEISGYMPPDKILKVIREN